MTATLDKPKDQRLIHSGIDWQQFKLIEQGFYDEVEILAVSHSSRYQVLLISCHSAWLAVILNAVKNLARCNAWLRSTQHDKQVPEVWFWEDGLFALDHLRSHGYEKSAWSEILPDLDINLLSRCLLMASRIEAVK